MQSRDSAVDVAYVAAHLLTPGLGSGGDVLFANLAREAARLRPEWRFAVVAPDYACEALKPYFETVAPFETPTGESRRVWRDPRDVALAWAGRIRSAQRVAGRLSARLFHATGDFLVDVLPAARAARGGRASFSGVVYHLNPPPLRRQNQFVASAGSWILQRASLGVLRRRCDRLFLLNEETRRALVRRGFGDAQLAVVGAGIDLNRFALAPVPPAAERVLWVHRLEPTKGIFDLPRLVALLPSAARLDVVGRGPRVWRERLGTELERLGLSERVTFHEYLETEALVQLYARANVFVSCSYEEGWGLSLAEALATGVPCVAYALPSHLEAFGDALQSVALGDVTALARSVTEVLQRTDSSEARARRRSAVAGSSFAAVAERYVGFMEPLLGAHTCG